MKKSYFKKLIASTLLLTLIGVALFTFQIYSNVATVSLNHDNNFVVTKMNSDGSFVNVNSYTNYNTAVSEMNRLHTSVNPHVVTTNVKSARGTYRKIVGQPVGGFAQSYPYRKGSVATAAVKDAQNTLKLYKDEELTDDNGYIPANYQLKVIEIKQAGASFVAKVQISGQIGWVDINKIDLIPRANMTNTAHQGGIPIRLGGYEEYYATPEASYVMNVKPEYFQVKKNGSYNEITFYQYRTYPGMYDAVSTFGIAPSWMGEGTYYSDDHIRYFTDVDRKNPVKNGTAVGEYYSYFEWLPVNSISLHNGDAFTNYLKSVNKTDSVYYNETQAFVENGHKYGMNALLIFAQANLESGYGTSKYAKDRNNLFGWNAVDSNPDNAARFASVSDSIKLHMQKNLMEYMVPSHWKHFGFSFGNMSSGVSYKYASDPLYGMKIANIAYSVDKANGFKDYNNYTLNKLKDNSSVSFLNGTGSGGTAYTSKALPNQIVANLGTSGAYYKTNRTVSNRSGQLIDLTKDFVYYPSSGTTNIAKYGPSANSLPGSLVVVGDTSKSYTFNSNQSLRTEWNDTSRVLTTIPQGTKINGKPTTNGYVYFSYGGYKGYVKESLISTGNTVKPPSKNGTYIVNAEAGLRLREKPNTSSDVLAVLPNGTKIEVIDEGHTDWVKTTYQGKTGYVHFDYLVKYVEKPDDGGSKEEPKFGKGDATGDGKINSRDIRAIKRHILGYETLTGDAFDRADVYVDNKINSRDIRGIKRHILGYEKIE